MYHRIVNPSSDAEYLEPGMYVKPETFAMQCSVIKKYFSVVPVSQIFKKQSDLSKKPLCAITFDDGWVDFLTNAAPVLRSQELPATVYLPTNYIDTDKRFWTDNCALIFKNLFSQNGGFTQSISEKVKSAGYAFAVTTKFGWNNNNSDLFALKRIGIHQDMTSTKSLTLSRIGRMSP